MPSPTTIDELVELYQPVSTHLSIVRSASSDAALVGRLSALVARGRAAVTGAHAPLASEFSRDALIEGKPEKLVRDQVRVPDKLESEKFYGMHRHFTDAGSVLLFGGGVKKGYLHGATADEPQVHFLGWAGEIDPEALFASGRAWGISLRRRRG